MAIIVNHGTCSSVWSGKVLHRGITQDEANKLATEYKDEQYDQYERVCNMKYSKDEEWPPFHPSEDWVVMNEEEWEQEQDHRNRQ